jgi:O-antigen/teichoic acid export membrane protein
MPLLAFIIAFSDIILKNLYGTAYEPGYVVLILFSAGMFFVQIGAIQRTILAGMRYLKIELIIVAAATVVNVILNALLIPLMGINGAAISSLCSCIALTVLGWHYTNRYAGIGIQDKMYTNILAGAVMLVLLVASRAISGNVIGYFELMKSQSTGIIFVVVNKTLTFAGLSVFFAAGLFAYAILLNLFRLLEPEDREIFQRILRRTGLPQGAINTITTIIFWDTDKTSA